MQTTDPQLLRERAAERELIARRRDALLADAAHTRRHTSRVRPSLAAAHEQHRIRQGYERVFVGAGNILVRSRLDAQGAPQVLVATADSAAPVEIASSFDPRLDSIAHEHGASIEQTRELFRRLLGEFKRAAAAAPRPAQERIEPAPAPASETNFPPPTPRRVDRSLPPRASTPEMQRVDAVIETTNISGRAWVARDAELGVETWRSFTGSSAVVVLNGVPPTQHPRTLVRLGDDDAVLNIAGRISEIRQISKADALSRLRALLSTKAPPKTKKKS